MTHYDMLVDTISQHLHEVYKCEEWNEDTAKQQSHKILETVEEFKRNRYPKRWRATD